MDPHWVRGRNFKTPFPKLTSVRKPSETLYLHDARWWGYPMATTSHPFWYPTPNNMEPVLNNDRHYGGANFLFMDGRVQYYTRRHLAVQYKADGVLYDVD